METHKNDGCWVLIRFYPKEFQEKYKDAQRNKTGLRLDLLDSEGTETMSWTKWGKQRSIWEWNSVKRKKQWKKSLKCQKWEINNSVEGLHRDSHK